MNYLLALFTETSYKRPKTDFWRLFRKVIFLQKEIVNDLHFSKKIFNYILSDDEAAVETMIKNDGINVNFAEKDRSQATPLHIAALKCTNTLHIIYRSNLFVFEENVVLAGKSILTS